MTQREREEAKTEVSEFQNFVDLMALYTDASNMLAKLSSEANEEMMETIDASLKEYAKLQEVLTKTEAALELIARKHPEWFADKASIKTPYGTVKLHNSTALVVDNEELTLTLIEREAEVNLDFHEDDYIRTTKSLNLEALATLDDAWLAKLRIRRDKRSNFSVTPAKLDMGKAVKAAQEKQQTTQAAA